jgi:hypothetical protein
MWFQDCLCIDHDDVCKEENGNRDAKIQREVI